MREGINRDTVITASFRDHTEQKRYRTSNCGQGASVRSLFWRDGTVPANALSVDRFWNGHFWETISYKLPAGITGGVNFKFRRLY